MRNRDCLACTNPQCTAYGKYVLPSEAKFCPKCGTQITETGAHKHYLYAVESPRGYSWMSWMRERTFRFYDSEGHPLDENEYLIVSGGSSERFSKCKSHLLVIRADGFPTLYYLSSDGKFHEIGEYDYNEGRRDDNGYKDYWKYDAYVIEDRYIQYRKGRDYQIFEICADCSVRKVAEYKSKRVFRPIEIIGDYAISENEDYPYTYNLMTGEVVIIPGYKGGGLLSLNDGQPNYLVADDWDSGAGRKVVNQYGEMMQSFQYSISETGSNGILVISPMATIYEDTDDYGIINSKGEQLLPCIYSEIEKINDNIYKLKESYLTKAYYLASINKVVYAYNDDCYVILSDDGESCEIFSMETGEKLNRLDRLVLLEERGDGQNYEICKQVVSDLYVEDDEVRSLYDNKVIYSFIEGEELVAVDREKFLIKGYSYLELYDHSGNLLHTIELDSIQDFHSFSLWDNGYITFHVYGGAAGWLDRDMVIHYVADYIKSEELPSIKNVVSDKCIIVDCGEYSSYVIYDGQCIYSGFRLEDVDADNYYGADYMFEDNENRWCIVNVDKGNIPVHGPCGSVFLIK